MSCESLVCLATTQRDSFGNRFEASILLVVHENSISFVLLPSQSNVFLSAFSFVTVCSTCLSEYGGRSGELVRSVQINELVANWMPELERWASLSFCQLVASPICFYSGSKTVKRESVRSAINSVPGRDSVQPGQPAVLFATFCLHCWIHGSIIWIAFNDLLFIWNFRILLTCLNDASFGPMLAFASCCYHILNMIFRSFPAHWGEVFISVYETDTLAYIR